VRALWSTTQLGLGLGGLAIAYVWVFVLVMAEENFSVGDLFLSFRVAGAAVRRLPDTRRPLCLGAWSATALVTAVLIVGGLGYWLPGKKPVRLRAGEGLFDLTSAEDTLETEPEANGNFWGTGGLGAQPPEGKSLTRCLVIGFIPEKDSKELNGLVLAVEDQGGLRYAGVVRRGLDAQNSVELLKRLQPLTTPKPAVPGASDKAIWVKPVIVCEIRQSGLSESGRFLTPVFKNVADWGSDQPKDGSDQPKDGGTR
jgi:hypothetical protein